MALVDTEKAAQQFGGFSNLPILRQLGLMAGLAASVALGVWVVNWAQSPDYMPLFGGMSPQDAAEVVQVLEQSGVPYKLNGNAVSIPAQNVHEMRLKLASQGVPSGKGGGGFELLDKEQPFGTSSFMEKARYNRALEGELSKSITTLASVQTARVHLAVPKRTVFTRRGNKASASVLVNLYPGRTLSDDQVAGIVYLVASSIPGMEAESVTVVDQQGRLLTNSKGNSQLAASTEQFRFVRDVESSYSQRIVELLTPMLGPDRVSAQVSIDMDFTAQESTSETFDPQQRAIRSEQVLNESRNGADGVAGGIPGALSNTPPEDGEEALTGETEAAEGISSTSSRATRNFELNRTVSHERKTPGTITRLSAAVVVDYVDQADDQGNVQRVPLQPEEIQRIEALVREAVGFSEARGDSVNVVNTAFRQDELIEPVLEQTSFMDELLNNPMYASWGKQLLGALAVILLIFGVLRPVLRSLAQQAQNSNKPQLATATGELQDGQLAEDQVTLTGQTGVLQLPGGPAISYEQQLDMAKSIAREDPKRVAQVVKSWVDEAP